MLLSTINIFYPRFWVLRVWVFKTPECGKYHTQYTLGIFLLPYRIWSSTSDAYASSASKPSMSLSSVVRPCPREQQLAGLTAPQHKRHRSGSKSQSHRFWDLQKWPSSIRLFKTAAGSRRSTTTSTRKNGASSRYGIIAQTKKQTHAE